MTWVTHPTLSTGSTVTAADWNSYVKGNIDTLFQYTAPKQIVYSDSTSSVVSVTASAALYILRANSGLSALEFARYEPVSNRQGQSSLFWFQPFLSTLYSTSTTNYTPTSVSIQAGSYLQAYPSIFQTIYFPVAFSVPPLVFCTQRVLNSGDGSTVSLFIQSSTLSYFNIDGDPSFPFTSDPICWVAIGSI